jgi:hypothetical protein
MGSKPYPATSSGQDLRQNREQLRDQYRISGKSKQKSDQ